MDNPFRAKGRAAPAFFCGREDIAAEMVRDLKAGTSIALAASRRSGKSWLAQTVLTRLRAAGLLTAYLDLIHVNSALQWVERFAGAVLSSISASPEELFRVTRQYLPSLGIESLKADPGGYRLRLSGSYGEREFRAIADQVYVLPRMIAKQTGKHVVVCLDEYPEIMSFLTPEIMERWRARVLDSKSVSYLLASTRPKVILDTFGPGAPMEGVVKITQLGKIPSAAWEEHILAGFRKSRFKVVREEAAAIVQATYGYSYYTQMVCSHLWSLRKDTRRILPEDIAGIADWVLDQEESYFEQIWRDLTKPRQNFLAAIAKDPDHPIFSADFRLAHRLPPASTLQSVVKYLEDQGLIERGATGCRTVDPFFQEWLRRNVI